MELLDHHILQLLGRYRVTVRSVLSLLTDDGSVPETALTRLLRDQLIMRSRALPGNRSVYQLTRKGAAAAGVSEARARLFQSQALFKHLGILLFCHVPGARRFRLEDDELRDLFGEALPEGAHVMTTTDAAPLLLNVHVPGPRTALRSIQRRLREQLAAAWEQPAVRPLLQQRTYGYGVVTETAERRKAILALLRKPERDGTPPLAKHVRIWVEALPEFDRLVNGVVPVETAESDRTSLIPAGRRARRKPRSDRAEEAEQLPLFQAKGTAGEAVPAGRDE